MLPSDEIHAGFVDELNMALRRPRMYGSEIGLRMLIGHLLFIEGEP
ncbi:hypothetical protein [Streptomyces gulbargensis]